MSTKEETVVSAEPVEVKVEAPKPAAPSTDAKSDAEPLGESGLAALQSERAARKVAEKAAADALAKIKEFEDRDKSEAEKQAEALAAARAELAELTVAKTRAEVAAAKGIPANLLSGSTQEELEASADALIAFRGAQAKPSAAPFIENTNKTTGEPDFDAAIAQASKDRNFALVVTLKQQKAAALSKG